MIEAKKVISNNLLDMDSNLNIIYQLLDEYKQMQPLVLTASDQNSGQTTGVDSAYTAVTFSNTRTSNFITDYFKFDSDGTIILDQTIVPHIFLTLCLQLNSPASAIGKALYLSLAFAYGDEDTYYEQSAYRVITPLTATSSEKREIVNYSTYVNIPNGVTKVKIYATTNNSEAIPITKAFLRVERTPSYAQ